MARVLDRLRPPCGPSKVHYWKKKRMIPADWQATVLEAGAHLKPALTAEDVMFPFPEDRGGR